MSEQLFQPVETPQDQNNTTNDDALKNLLASIRNEQGQQKYKSVEEALKGLQHAQNHIHEIKSERNTIAAQLEQERSVSARTAELERVVAELTQRREQKPVETPTPSISEESISNLVKSQLASARQEEQQSQNRTLVKQTLIAKFGEDKAGEIFTRKADELGVSAERLTQLAAESPKAVLAMLGVSGDGASKQPRISPSTPAIRTEGFEPRRDSLIGNKDAFRLPTGHTTADVMAMKQRSDQLLEELNASGITVDDLTNPANYFKVFK